MSATSG